jgi:hypothetical protein
MLRFGIQTEFPDRVPRPSSQWPRRCGVPEVGRSRDLGNTSGRSTVATICSKSSSLRASGDALRCPSLPGAGAKQEQRLFRDLPELLSTAANGPVLCQGFSVSAVQRIVEIILGEKWQLLVRSRGRSLHSGPLRSSSDNPVYWPEDGGGASPGLSGELPVPAGVMRGAAAC